MTRNGLNQRPFVIQGWEPGDVPVAHAPANLLLEARAMEKDPLITKDDLKAFGIALIFSAIFLALTLGPALILT